MPSVSEEELRYYEGIKNKVSRESDKKSRDVTNASEVSATTAQSPRKGECSNGLLSTALLPPLHLYQDVGKENE